MRLLGLLVAYLLCISFAFAQTQTVTNLSDSGTGSLRDAVGAAAAGDTIKFSPGLLSQGENDTIFLFSDILIDKGLYFLGLDHDTAKIVLSGSDSTRIFRVDVSASPIKAVTFNHMFFTDARAVTLFGEGGALLIQQLDTLRILNSEFRNCHATDKGGAIYARSYNFLIPVPKYTEMTNCQFSQNSVDGSSAKGGHMEFDHTGPIYMNHCAFSDNVKSGSKIEFCDGLYIENTIIHNNGTSSANTDSRAFIVSQTDTIYANNIVAHNNYTNWKSPVFWLRNNRGVLIENSLFFNNQADEAGVFGSTSNIVVKNCQFYDNTAQVGGVTDSEKITFEQCIFKRNSATSHGGVLFYTGNNAGRYSHFYECELDSNSSGNGGGGAVFVSHSDFRFERSSATHNTTGGEGGAFRILGFRGSTLISHSTVVKNSAINEGGAMAVSNIDSIKIKNSTFAYNHSATAGDFSYFVWTDSIEVEGSIIINHGAPFAYYSQSSTDFVSRGFNILEFNHPNLMSSDLPDIDSSYHILDSLRPHSGIGKIMLPLPKTLAVNRGNPMDNSLAQNGGVVANIRDIGAAESNDSSIIYTQSLAVCDSIFLNGVWRDSIGLYIDTMFNANGLDSVSYVWIQEMNTAFVDTQTVRSCDGYTWIDGITYSSSTDSAQVVLTSVNGCDSIIRLNYTRLATSFVDTQKVMACSPYTWIDGNVYIQDTDTASVTYNSFYNCDSTLYLDLSLTMIDTAVLVMNTVLAAADSNAQYQWVDCNQNYIPLSNGNQRQYVVQSNGSYAVILTKNSCVDTSSCVEINNIGVDEYTNLWAKVYPNPTDGAVYIDIEEDVRVASIKIYNGVGTLIQSFSTDVQERLMVKIDEPSGFYYVELTGSDGQRSRFRIVKR